MDDPLCKCGHYRSDHDEEQPYYCCAIDADDFNYCPCTEFTYPLKPLGVPKET